MYLDLDPSSPTYQQAPIFNDDDHDQLISLGSWRLPRSRHAAGLMLWRLWDLPELDPRTRIYHEDIGESQEHVARRCNDLREDRNK